MTTYKSVLHNRSLIILGLSESVSNIGNWITMMAVFAMIVFSGKGSVAQSSGIFLAGLLPTLFFSPAAGWLCDHLDRKWLMIASELTSGLIIAGIIVTQRLEFIYFLLALQSISTSIMSPARQSVVPDVVLREDLTGANAFLQQLSSLIKIAAPILAGALLTIMNPHQAVILDVISFILSAAILTFLPSLPPHQSPAVDITYRQTKRVSSAGILSTLKGSPRLSLLIMLELLAVVIFIGFDVLAPIYIRDVMGGNESLFGSAIGLVGLGSLISTLVLVLRRHPQNPWRDVLTGLVLLGAIPASMSLGDVLKGGTAAIPLIAAGCLIGGVGNGLLNIQAATLLQLLSPAELLGRMGGVFQSAMVAGQLAGIMITPLIVPALLPMGMYFIASSLAVVVLVMLTAIILMLTRSVPGKVGAAGN
jgi:MFS family permease